MIKVRWILLFFAILICVTVALYLGFHNPLLPTGSEWTCPRMLKIKQEWDLVSKTPTHSKNEYQELQHSLDNIIRSNLSTRNIRQLAVSCEMLAANSEERSDFENAVLRYIVRVLVDSGDRVMLVKTLSTRCPNEVSPFVCIEFHFVLRGKKLKDPIMILGEAYSKCQDSAVRQVIAAAVRRGFTDMGVKGKDDDEFVNNAMQWYEKEKNHLVVNNKYVRNSAYFSWKDYKRNPKLYDKWPSFKREPLFIKK